VSQHLLISPTCSADELKHLSVIDAVSSRQHPPQLATPCHMQQLNCADTTHEEHELMGNQANEHVYRAHFYIVLQFTHNLSSSNSRSLSVYYA